MFFKKNKLKKTGLSFLFAMAALTIYAQEIPAGKIPGAGTNLLAVLLVITAAVLAFVIWGLGQVLVTLSRQMITKINSAGKIKAVSIFLFCFALYQSLNAQDIAATEVVKIIPNYGGLSASAFYFLMAVIATEVCLILFLFFLIKRIYSEMVPEKAAALVKASRLSALWVSLDKKIFTKAIPIEKEADHLLDHNYDGIQELDNALPPWWKYGFILTIGISIVYLLHFHVLGNGKNPLEEYKEEVAIAQFAKDEYEAKNKDRINELNVPMAGAAGIKIGKDFFMANCTACHGVNGEGGAGPNLTDDYWLHKGGLNDIYATIKKGYPDKGMQSWAIKFNPKEISEIASFITTLKGTKPANPKAPQGDLLSPSTDTIGKLQAVISFNK